jgi:hypothetical protein
MRIDPSPGDILHEEMNARNDELARLNDDLNNPFSEIIAIVRDITERKWVQEVLRKSYEELEMRVLERLWLVAGVRSGVLLYHPRLPSVLTFAGFPCSG